MFKKNVVNEERRGLERVKSFEKEEGSGLRHGKVWAAPSWEGRAEQLPLLGMVAMGPFCSLGKAVTL